MGEVAGCILQWMVHNGTRVFGADASNKTLLLLSEPSMVDALMQVRWGVEKWPKGRNSNSSHVINICVKL